MATMWNTIGNYYDWLMSKGDPRVADWPLMSSPFAIWSIMACYVYVVKVLGPRFMVNRKPYKIENIIIAYNVLMVISSAMFFHYGGQLTYIPPGGNYSLFCEKIDYSVTDNSMSLLRLGWWLLFLKMFEFADTIFFVLRKKFTHISVLHVVHHSVVPWGVWIGLKFGAGGHNAFFPLINLAIHTIMYTYYCLTALGPGVRKYLWWKRYLTILQMVQFCAALIHASIPLVVDCGFQPFFAYAIIGHAIFFWVMFYNFYRKRYNEDDDKGAVLNKESPPSMQKIKADVDYNGNSAKANQVLKRKLVNERLSVH